TEGAQHVAREIEDAGGSDEAHVGALERPARVRQVLAEEDGGGDRDYGEGHTGQDAPAAAWGPHGLSFGRAAPGPESPGQKKAAAVLIIAPSGGHVLPGGWTPPVPVGRVGP